MAYLQGRAPTTDPLIPAQVIPVPQTMAVVLRRTPARVLAVIQQEHL
jgi:hypothetical protein